MGQQIDEPYLFPLKPGTEAWGNLKSETAKISATQIPDSILSKMTTSALTYSCINYPRFGNYIAFKNYPTGYEVLKLQFNGLKELANRNDAAKYLVDVYQKAGIKGFEGLDLNLEQKHWTLKFIWLELLLSQDNIIQSMSPDEKEDLLEISYSKFNMKKANEFAFLSLSTTVFLMAKILNSLNYNEFEQELEKENNLEILMKTARVDDLHILDNILILTENYLKL